MTRNSARDWWLLGGLLAVAASVWLVAGTRRAARVEVATALVSDGSIVRRVVATGTLQAIATVQVGAQVSGSIQSLEADFNSIVRSGQVLARLDPALFQASLREAQADLARAQAAEKQAQADQQAAASAADDARQKLTRAEELAARDLIPRSDLDAALIAMDAATAALQTAGSQVRLATAASDEARAGVSQAKVNLDHTVITSPIDGIVLARSVDIGQTVASAFQTPVLFTIAADLKRMQVETDIDESDIGGVHAGEAAIFEVESYPDRTFEGTVSSMRLQPVVDQTTATPASATTGAPASTLNGSLVSYATIVTVSNPDERLRPGMTATVTLDGSRRDHVVRIPNNALMFRPDSDVLRAAGQSLDFQMSPAGGGDAAKRLVWRFDGSRFTPVSIGVGIADGRWTELLSGSLRAGDSLVTSATLAVDDGR